MKFYLVILSLFLAIHFQNENRIVGRWKVEKIVQGKQEKLEGSKWIEFHKDGTMNGGTVGEDPTRNGRWTFDKKTKVITFISEPKAGGDDGDYKIIKLKKKTMILSREDRMIHLALVEK